METPSVEGCTISPKDERRISGASRRDALFGSGYAGLGLRYARYFGKKKTRFQVTLAATVANLSLVAS
jgi:hypothetical protein